MAHSATHETGGKDRDRRTKEIGQMRWRTWLMATALAGAVTAAGLAGPAAAQQETRSLQVRNSGSVPLSSIHVSPDYSNRWGGDRLASDELEPGDSVQVDLSDHAEDCFFDVQVDDAEGQSREFWGVNVCNQRFLDVRKTFGAALKGE
jgi:hypothetical protein